MCDCCSYYFLMPPTWGYQTWPLGNPKSYTSVQGPNEDEAIMNQAFTLLIYSTTRTSPYGAAWNKHRFSLKRLLLLFGYTNLKCPRAHPYKHGNYFETINCPLWMLTCKFVISWDMYLKHVNLWLERQISNLTVHWHSRKNKFNWPKKQKCKTFW